MARRRSSPKNRLPVTLIVIGAVILILTVGLGVAYKNHAFDMAVFKYKSATVHPRFELKSDLPRGWFTTGNAAMYGPNSYSSDQDVPKVAFSVLEGESVKKPKQNGCFTSFYFIENKQVDIKAELYEHEHPKFDGGNTFDKLPTLSQTIDTYDGPKNMEIYQYKINHASTEYMMDGLQLGWLNLSNGYIYMTSVCRTAQDLAKLTPILEQIELKS